MEKKLLQTNSLPEPSDDFNSGVIRKTELFDLFISYKRDHGADNGQKLAMSLYRKLTADGFKVWIDHEEIGFSTDFEKRIEKALLHSKKVACVLSPAWVESINCMYELKQAIFFEKRIIPLHYRDFRGLLEEKMKMGKLTRSEWRKVDKPQEVDLSSEEKFEKGYNDLKALCFLHDESYERHAELLCLSRYWLEFNKPKSLLLRGLPLSKAKLFRSKCSGDDDYPSFSENQIEFLQASEELVKTEITNKRDAYIIYSTAQRLFANELNFELRLHGVSTWFQKPTDEQEDPVSFEVGIINCKNLILVETDQEKSEEDARIAFARNKNKRIIKVTNSPSLLKILQERGEKNVHFWHEQLNIDELITKIKGDEAYNSAHAKLLELTYEWQKNDKKSGKLLSLKEAKEKQEWYQNAEQMGHEPQPGLDMVNFVERSITNGESLKRRKRMTLWSTVVGLVLLLGFIGVSIRLNVKVEEAEQKIIQADKKVKETQEKVIEADLELGIVQQQAEEIKESLAKSNQEVAFAKAEAAEVKRLANIELSKATEKVDSLNGKFSEEKTRFAEAQAENEKKLKEASVSLAESMAEVNRQKVIADSIAFITRGRSKAVQAAEFVQSRETRQAKLAADLAYELLTDSVQSSAQLQTLYDVYTYLIPQNSLLSLGFKQNELTLKQIKENLIKQNYPAGNELQEVSGFYELNGSKVYLKHPKGKLPVEKINKILEHASQSKPNQVSAIAINPNWTLLAVGFKTGEVEVWDLRNPQTHKFKDKIVQHSHRITCLAFAPDGRQLTIASIDEYFSIINLTVEGKREAKGEIIRRSNGSRIQDLHYYDNRIVITQTWEDYANVWPTDIPTLRDAVTLNAP